MRTIRLIFSILFIFPPITALFWQTPGLLAQTLGERWLEFEQFTVNDGLSQNFVTCILQDHQGFLWFGTRDGLNRYDGHEFKVYSFDAENTTSLSANAIQTIYEDRYGNLWVGTWFGGLNKYERATDRFVRYRFEREAPSGPTQHFTFPIQEDRSGMLWLGTADGLKRFDPQTGRFTSFIYKPDDPQSWKYNSVFAILEAEDGNLWLGTRYEYSGLLYFNRTTETFAHFKVDPKNFTQTLPLIIRAICRDQSGNLWVGDAAGLFRINEQWLRGQVGNSSPYEGPGAQGGFVGVAGSFATVISALCQDEAGNLWIGSPDGLFIYDVDPRLSLTTLAMENRGVTRILPNLGVTSIYKDRSGLMWLGTNGNGIYKWRSAQQRFGRLTNRPNNAYNLGSNSIRAIYEAGDSTLWIGGYNSLDKLDRKSGRVAHYPRQATGYGGESVWAIYEDPLSERRILWIGTEGGGLYRFDRASEKFTRYQNAPGNSQSLNDNFVLSVYRDSSGTLWVGTNSGLNSFDDRTEKFTQYNHDPTNPHGLRGAFILSICESRYGPHAGRVLWLATTNGLSCFDPAAEQFTHFAHDPRNPQSLGYNEILCLKQDRRGRIWIGTGGGLNQLVLPTPASLDKNPTENRSNDTGATFVHYTEKNGLPNNFINGILEDEAGDLWLSTNKGLSRFNPDTGVFRNFSVSDGLQSDEFNRAAYYQCRHGEMFLGGVNGLNMFFPTAIKDNPHLPPVVITDFKLFNQPVGLATNEESPLKKVIAATGELRLSYKDNVFSFEFAALEYTAPEKNQYAYKMEGFDRDWIRIGAKREAVYTNLAPGKYTFRVKASNNDGRWNEAGASLKITITPPWWQTWWFRMGSILAILGLIISGHRLRTGYIKAKNRALVQEIAERQQAEMKFRGVLESAPDAMLVTNERGNILLINTQAEKLLGYSREELTGMGVETLVPLSLRDQHAQHRQDFHQNMSQRPMGSGRDVAVLCKDGREIPVEITLSPLETREGIWVIAAVRDMTERKKNIDALRRSREQLRALTRHLHHTMERERVSISQDIHDELGGVLTALKIDLTLLERGLEKNSGPKEEDLSLKEIRAMKQTIDATIGKMREFVRRLRPDVLDDLGLVAALEWQMQEFHQRIGVGYEFNSAATALAVEENCAIAVFRIFQEALTNISRHASASQVVVQISQNQDHALIKIIDNGIGIPAEKLAAPDTFGLLGMRERALMFGGEVEITSAPGEGTAVIIKVPLAR